MRKMFSKAKSFITKKSTLIGIGVLVGLIYLVAPNNSVGDWRKGSSASLQATISLDAAAFRNSNLDDSIHVWKSSDYEQCIKDVVINVCWCGMNSNYEIKFTNSKGESVGYVKFHEPYATHFEVKEIHSDNGYLVSVKTISTADRHSNFDVTISIL
jgi:hypothetical protein